MIINSTANKHIKDLVKLQERKERLASGLFLIEGEREFEMAVRFNYEITEIIFCAELLNDNSFVLIAQQRTIKTEVSSKVFARIAYRENSAGFVAVARQKKGVLKNFFLPAEPLVIILEKIEKPGNLGAILRTADAAGVDLVIVSEPLPDLYNPNIVRASLGALFSVPVIVTTNQGALTWLQEKKFSIITTTPSAVKEHYALALNGSTAIVIGSEKDGVTDFWLKNATAKALIPMSGSVNSLNASVSAAIVVYEAVRQRKNK